MIRWGRPDSPAATARSGVVIVLALGAATAALWLLPASQHVIAWPRSGLHRVAVLAPLSRLWLVGASIAALAAGLVVITRARGRPMTDVAWVLAPLNIFWVWTFPYWPWVGERLPLGLLLAGPLRWAFAALAIGAAVSRTGAFTAVFKRLAGWPWRGRRTAFAVSFALYGALGVHSYHTLGLGGDEPHYLVITQSLLADRDLKIENNHRNDDYRSYFPGELRPDYLRRGVDGEIYSIHAPGLSLVLLPAFALFGAVGAVVMMAAISALAAVAIFDVAVAVSSVSLAWLTWLAVCLTVPFLPHAWALYPEMIGAFVIAWAVKWGVAPARPGDTAWLWRGAALGSLPWLHTKFSVLLACVAALLVWQLRTKRRAVVALLVPIGLSGVAWLGFFYWLYGTVDPQAPYGAYTAQFVRAENIPRSLLGLIFDQKFGLLVYAPIYAIVAWGFGPLFRDQRWRAAAIACLGTALVYTLSSARLYMWWGGSSAPARFLAPIVPLLAPMVAAGLARAGSRAAVALWTTCGVVSVVIGLGATMRPADHMLYSAPHGVALLFEWLQGPAPLTAALPTFTQEDWFAPARALLPWLFAVPLACLAGAACASVTRGRAATVASAGVAFLLVVAVAVTSFAPEVRAEVRTRGLMTLLDRWDPQSVRVFDYGALKRLSPQEWLELLTVTFDREPNAEVDPSGRITEALTLPPGFYDVRVWFDGERPRAGALQATVGHDQVLAKIDGPLTTPAVMPLLLPMAVPTLWLQLTDLESARTVRRVEVVARALVARPDRPREIARVIETVPGPPGSYIGYFNEETYPERGVFWTRERGRGRVIVVTGGARTLVMTLHVGPKATNVTVRVGSDTQTFALSAEETREVRWPLSPNRETVPVDVAADASFRPSDVDRRSTDTRQLGCQVRLVLD